MGWGLLDKGNICHWYSLEASLLSASNDYLQYVFDGDTTKISMLFVEKSA